MATKIFFLIQEATATTSPATATNTEEEAEDQPMMTMITPSTRQQQNTMYVLFHLCNSAVCQPSIHSTVILAFFQCHQYFPFKIFLQFIVGSTRGGKRYHEKCFQPTA